jgi:HPt (histidine-containing phosphotransfer) domain-containing protein
MQLTQEAVELKTRGSVVVANEPLPFDLDQLRRRCMGRLDLIERLLSSFDKRFPLALVELESCLASGEAERFVQLAHQLKGASANISAARLQGLLQKMEDAARAGKIAAARESLTQLQSEWETFTEYKGSACLS